MTADFSQKSGLVKLAGLTGAGAFPGISEKAVKTLETLPFPDRKTEFWKYSRLDGLKSGSFTIAGNSFSLTEPDLEAVRFGSAETDRIVLEDGRLNQQMTAIHSGSPVRMLTPDQALELFPGLADRLTAGTAATPDYFAELGKTSFSGFLILFLPAGKVQKRPVHLISYTTGTFSQPKLLVLSGKSSELTLIEHFTGKSSAAGFTNSDVRFLTEENAVVHHVRIVDEPAESAHIGRIEAWMQANSVWNSRVITLGGKMVRNQITARLEGEGANCRMEGVYLATGSSHAENITLIDHQKPNGTSQETFRGILGGEATGVFDGKIIVQKGAQKTFANQSNKNLLLSDQATADAKPQLEIYADDVKCYHGATVGQLDETQLFYLQSRGIGKDMARALLTHAFALDVLRGIPVPAIVTWLDHQILDRLNSPVHFGEEE